MVLGLCRRVLGDEHAAEDAFQATFLVLVKKAGGLRDYNLLSNWLYGVALRIANKEKAKGARRRIVERQATEKALEAVGDVDQAELRSVIDEEIRRLPERYRVPLVLCHLEGLRHDEVAKRLGCPVGTVESRLSRASGAVAGPSHPSRSVPTASALTAMLKPPVASAVFPSLVEATLQVAFEQSSSRSAVGTIIASLGCLVERMSGLLPTLHARAVMSTLVLCTSVAVVGFGVYQADGEPERRPEPPPATRDPSAVAYALSGITIDGRLDDWPKDLRVYPIRNQLVTNSSYIVEERDPSQDSDAYFMVGYDREAGADLPGRDGSGQGRYRQARECHGYRRRGGLHRRDILQPDDRAAVQGLVAGARRRHNAGTPVRRGAGPSRGLWGSLGRQPVAALRTDEANRHEDEIPACRIMSRPTSGQLKPTTAIPTCRPAFIPASG